MKKKNPFTILFLTFHQNPTNGNKNESNIMDIVFVVTKINLKNIDIKIERKTQQ